MLTQILTETDSEALPECWHVRCWSMRPRSCYITHPIGAPFGSSARGCTNFLNSLFSTGLVLPCTRSAYYSMFNFLHHWIGAWQLLASILIQAVQPINTVNRTLMFELMLLELVQFDYFVKIIITVCILYIYM